MELESEGSPPGSPRWSFSGGCSGAGHGPPLAEKNVPEKNRPPSPSRLPPRPQTYSKGTATNLPEKEISAFLSMFLNEALTLLWFHREVEELLGGWGEVKGLSGLGYAGMTAFIPDPCAPPLIWV